MARFLTIVDGVRRLANAIAQSVGVSDAGKIVETHDNGKIHNSLINWDAPGAIGGTTPDAIAGTSGKFGGVTIGSNLSEGARLSLNAPSGILRDITFFNTGIDRFILRCNNSDDLSFITRNDDGSFRDTPLTIPRATGGSVVLARPTAITNNSASTSTTSGALTVSGGLGIGGAINAGGAISSSSNLTTGNGTGAISLTVNGAAGTTRDVQFLSGGSARWFWRVNADAETGANAGSSFLLIARADNGAIIDTPISIVRAASGGITLARPTIVTQSFRHTGSSLGFYNATAIAKPTITGSRGGNAALASLLTQLANLGLITDSTTA